MMICAKYDDGDNRDAKISRTAQKILRKYRILQSTPSGEYHAKKYIQFQKYVLTHQDALFELVFSGKVGGLLDLNKLVFFGSSGGSLGREYNERWVPFIARVRERQKELPKFIADGLDWLLATHGW